LTDSRVLRGLRKTDKRVIGSDINTVQKTPKEDLRFVGTHKEYDEIEDIEHI
jgi:mRNA-degrading endonuclease HigB of HigAB toxin-antitoxin module